MNHTFLVACLNTPGMMQHTENDELKYSMSVSQSKVTVLDARLVTFPNPYLSFNTTLENAPVTKPLNLINSCHQSQKIQQLTTQAKTKIKDTTAKLTYSSSSSRSEFESNDRTHVVNFLYARQQRTRCSIVPTRKIQGPAKCCELDMRTQALSLGSLAFRTDGGRFIMIVSVRSPPWMDLSWDVLQFNLHRVHTALYILGTLNMAVTTGSGCWVS
jgi:hypothetical protein